MVPSKKIITIAAGIFFTVCSAAFAIPKISDPLKINLPINPSIVNSGDTAELDLSLLPGKVQYQATCSIETHTNNDPMWFISSRGLSYLVHNVIVDGKPNSKEKDALMLVAGTHIVKFSFTCEQGCSIKVQNASNDVFNFEKCEAELD